MYKQRTLLHTVLVRMAPSLQFTDHAICIEQETLQMSKRNQGSLTIITSSFKVFDTKEHLIGDMPF